MTLTTLPELGYVNEPQQAGDYAAMLSRVAESHQPLIIRRHGDNLVAVVSLEHLELMREALANQEAERLAAQLDFSKLSRSSQPPTAWFEGDEPKPF